MPRVSDKELSMARKLVESLATEFDPGKYQDEYRERVLDFLKKKAKGKTITIEEPEEQTAAVTDLMEALKASVEGSRKKSRPKKTANGRKRKSA
jgi:DNA end-binding protein Ku